MRFNLVLAILPPKKQSLLFSATFSEEIKALADRLAEAFATLAERLQCVVVLKGSGSVVAAPRTTPSINASGNAMLATPGTGDVLAGWLGGLWAQHASGSASAIVMSGDTGRYEIRPFSTSTRTSAATVARFVMFCAARAGCASAAQASR